MSEEANFDLSEIYDILKDSGSQSKKSLSEIIAEKKEEVGLSNLQMSRVLGIDKTTFDRILERIESGEAEKVDMFFVLKLCHLLGIGIKDMAQLYVSSLTSNNIAELERPRKAHFIMQNFDIKGLKKINFIDSISDFDKIEKRIVTFFRLKDGLFSYKDEVGEVLFKRAKAKSHDKMREFWVRCAYYQFEKISNPNDYNRDLLLEVIPGIGPYTRHEEKGFLAVLRSLYHIGVTVIIQPYLHKTQVQGGTFLVNGKPCIVITDFNKHYAQLWFALLHELYHVLYDLEKLKVFTYHLSGEPQSELYLADEERADFFAIELLFPKEKLNFIKHLISSPVLVADYAKENGIHPSIIYFYHCLEERREGINVFPLYRNYFGNATKPLHLVQTNPWNKETIYDGIEHIKELLTT